MVDLVSLSLTERTAQTVTLDQMIAIPPPAYAVRKKSSYFRLEDAVRR
jgi:hypothetical protein